MHGHMCMSHGHQCRQRTQPAICPEPLWAHGEPLPLTVGLVAPHDSLGSSPVRGSEGSGEVMGVPLSVMVPLLLCVRGGELSIT